MAERRIYKRFDRNIPVKLQVINPVYENTEKPHYLLTKNICAGGIFLETKQSFPKGTDVTLEIAIPAENHISTVLKDHCFVKAIGAVVRTEPGGMALTFNKDFQIEFGELPEHFLHNTSL